MFGADMELRAQFNILRQVVESTLTRVENLEAQVERILADIEVIERDIQEIGGDE